MMIKKWKVPFVLLTLVVWYGCSGMKKADISSSANPTEEIGHIEEDLAIGKSRQYDVLAYEDFHSSEKYLEKAKKQLQENVAQDKVLDELRYSKGFLEQAASKAEARRGDIEPILIVRQKALNAGVLKYPQFTRDWRNAESDTKDLSKKRSVDVKIDAVKDLQDRYSNLELMSIQENNLGNAVAKINSAKERNARSLAPKSLKDADQSFATATNMIAASRYQSYSYSPEVLKANKSANRLSEVMELVTDKKRKIGEEAAIVLVAQNEKITDQAEILAQKDNEIKNQEEIISNQDSSIDSLGNAALHDQETLGNVEKQLALKKSLTLASKQFSAAEADVYQKDDKLIIRLKSLNFSSGKSTLPRNASAILAKVEGVVRDLKAQEILVQGHTDSVGGRAINQKLSEDRAATVVKYLLDDGVGSLIHSEGLGDTSPLTTNKTAVGRAENRRIDIVITPLSL
ncbi:MAG: OmpA family protein [Bacteriovoracaceae bacterium]